MIQAEIPGTARLDPPPFDLASIQNLLATNRDHLVIILGHIEDANFVRSDADGRNREEVSIEKIEKLALQYGTHVIYLGCYSAFCGVTGISSAFNSLDAVQRIATAMSATDYRQFLERLTSGSAPLVVAWKDIIEIGQLLRVPIHDEHDQPWGEVRFPIVPPPLSSVSPLPQPSPPVTKHGVLSNCA